jgi:hypothetical protein
MAAEARAAGLEVRLRLADEVPAALSIDSRALTCVMLALLLLLLLYHTWCLVACCSQNSSCPMLPALQQIGRVLNCIRAQS